LADARPPANIATAPTSNAVAMYARSFARITVSETRRTDRRSPARQRPSVDVERQPERREPRASRTQPPGRIRVERERDFYQIGGDEPSHYFVLSRGDIRRAGRKPLAGHVVEIDGENYSAWVVKLVGLHKRGGDLSEARDIDALG